MYNQIPKSAIFGPFQALKKQSIRLFLAKRQSTSSKETLGSFKTNRGAMFGLDARIALAIFGALSVISGASLYSAIKQARSTQINQELQEIIKASEAYYLDNGSPIDNYSVHETYTSDLLDNSRKNAKTWKGPYLAGTKVDNDMFIHPNIGNGSTTIEIDLMRDDETAIRTCLATDTDCYEFIEIQCKASNNDYDWCKNIFPDLDAFVDNSDGKQKGTVRAIDNTGVTYYIYYKGIYRNNIN